MNLALLANLPAQIATARMLIALGVSTAEDVRAFFHGEGHDDEALAAIMAGCDVRIARLQQEQAARDAAAGTPHD